MARARNIKIVFKEAREIHIKMREVNAASTGQPQEPFKMPNLLIFKQPSIALIAVLGLAAACAAAPNAVPTDPVPVADVSEPVAEPDPGPISLPDPQSLAPFSPSGNAAMDAWREDFAARALLDGRDGDVIEATLAGISPLALYLGSDVTVASTGVADQAEFAKPIWDYVASAVTDRRKTLGAEKIDEFEAMFQSIEQAYGVDREALTAIWAMETNLGGYIGTYDAANTLANMAVEGRRQRFAENELLALMKIQERGEADRDDFISGWAGAMGQTQFMPSTFLAYAVDFDGDGKKDLWNSEADALASAANYLAASGYRSNRPWGLEVGAVNGFDWSLADGQDRRLSTWIQAGLSMKQGGGFPVDPGAYAELWLPTGASGPKYLLFENFDVYKTYNRSDSYAFAVGLLTDGMGGQDGPIERWPTEIELLNSRDIERLQTRLNANGFDAGPVDGIAGRGTRAALQRFQKANGLVADGYPSRAAFEQVLAITG